MRLAKTAGLVRDRARRAIEGAPEAGVEVVERGQGFFDANRRRLGRASEANAGKRLAAAGAGAGAEFGRVRRRARQAVDLGGQKGQEVTGQAKDQAQRVAEQTSSKAQAIAAQATTVAVAGAGRAREVGGALADAAKDRVPQVTQKLSDDVVPTLRDVAMQAASAAIDLWQTARERAADAAPTDLAPHAAQAVAAGGERAREATAAVAGRAAEIGKRAKEASRRTADATVDAGKDTGAVIFWAGAAAGLLYYAVLSPERRAQLLSAASSVTYQVQELIKDFQGYDDEF